MQKHKLLTRFSLKSSSYVQDYFDFEVRVQSSSLSSKFEFESRSLKGPAVKNSKRSSNIITKLWFLSIPHNEVKRGKKVHFGRTMLCLPQRLKSTFFDIFPSGVFPKGTQSEEKISKNVDFSLFEEPPKHTFEIGIFSIF